VTVYRFTGDPFYYEIVDGVYKPLSIRAAQFAQTAEREGALTVLWVGVL